MTEKNNNKEENKISIKVKISYDLEIDQFGIRYHYATINTKDIDEIKAFSADSFEQAELRAIHALKE